MNLKDESAAGDTTRRRLLRHATESYVLFPALAVLVLGVVWGATLYLINVERVAAERTAATSTRELAETYEAQVVRAVREIDQALKLVKFAYEIQHDHVGLSDLKIRTLLPPDMLFVVGVADAEGKVVASTRPSEAANVADQDFFQAQRRGNTLAVGGPRRSTRTGEWTLQFSRRLDSADGSFAGIAMVAVDAAYFVSGYEPRKLGSQGVLGMVRTDGVFLARRTGEAVSAGDRFAYASAAPGSDQPDAEALLMSSPWDGVGRYTVARGLYDFPMAVVVGLAREEQLAPARRQIRAYLWLATAGSMLVVMVFAVLGRMSWRLAQSRARQVAEQVTHAEQVEYLAYHDGLTNLPNRSLFSKLLGQSIHEALRFNRHLAVLFLDLDRFKHINDTLGHDAGDQLLRDVAGRLRACVRESDTVSRMGGDEFVLLLPEVDEEKYVATVAQKILAAIAKPFVLLGQEFRVTASIGISTFPQDGRDEQTLTKNADIAMYRAKEDGRNNFRFYSAALNAESLERLALESSLREALEHKQFELDYQPKQDMRSGRVTGMEALLRWNHPKLGMVAPLRFINVAEEMGLTIPIGKWVTRTACLQSVAWQKQGLPRISMAVNMTAHQFFDENLVRDLAAILSSTGMEPALLEIEISENVLTQDIDRSLGVLTRLKALGLKVAVDDFGIGYSSLSTLKQLSLDTIKIDRSFIRGLASNAADRNLASAIIALGGNLSLTVVAQGVETKQQADFLREHACGELQGFYFNKPLPADQCAQLLRAQVNSSDVDAHRAETV